MNFTKKMVVRAVALRRQAKLLAFIKNTPASRYQIISYMNESYRNVNYDLGRLKKIGAVKVAYSKQCPIAKSLCGFYLSTGCNFEIDEFMKNAESLGIDELVTKTYQAISENKKINATDYSEKELDRTIIKVESNPNATIYLNSKKPAGWYKWQRSKKDRVVRAPGCSFSVI